MQGDVNSGRMGLADRSDIEMDSGNVVVTYTKPLDAGESFQILGYADREHRDVPRQSWENRATYNVEGQHSIRLTPRYSLMWGGGVRSTLSRTRPTEVIFFEPDDRTINQVHGFAQTDITLTPAFSASRSARAASGRHSADSSCSLRLRAKYTPQARHHGLGRHLARRAHADAVRPGPARNGQQRRRDSRRPRLQARAADGVRVGRAVQPARERVGGSRRSFTTTTTTCAARKPTPLITLANLYDGHTTGVELGGKRAAARAMARARELHGTARVAEAACRAAATRPTRARRPTIRRTLFSMRSYLNLPRNLELDGFFRAVGKLRASNLPGYQELDMRIGWQATDRLELSIMGRELLHARHAEFAGGGAQLRYFQREVALRVTFETR